MRGASLSAASGSTKMPRLWGSLGGARTRLGVAVRHWAVEAEHVKVDPTVAKSVTKPATKGFPVWDEEEIIQFEKRWPRGTRERV